MQKVDIRDSVAVFAEAMEAKLQTVDDKESGWEGLALDYLITRLLKEVDELLDAVLDTDPEWTMSECCDVANFSMMIFSLLHPITKHNQNGHAIPKMPRFKHDTDDTKTT